jgi:chromosome partitioning protein
MENRREWQRRSGAALPTPDCVTIARSTQDSREAAEAEERKAFDEALGALQQRCDFVIIDSPGSDSYLSRIGHAAADTLITPLNDSFVDFDLLAKVDPQTLEVRAPSLYSEMVWDSRKRRALKRHAPIDWIVMRNRLTSLDARNKRKIADMLDTLAQRIGFRVAPGFGERVIYRELFPMGLTLLDLAESGLELKMTMSHVAARQELRDLLRSLKLPRLGNDMVAL